MRTAIPVVVLVGVLSVMAFAVSDVSGTWKVSGDVVGNPVSPTLTLTQEGEALRGTAAMPGSDAVPLTGTVKDGAVTFTFDVTHDGAVYSLTFAGTIGEDGAMKGNIDVQGMADGQFTAARQ